MKHKCEKVTITFHVYSEDENMHLVCTFIVNITEQLRLQTSFFFFIYVLIRYRVNPKHEGGCGIKNRWYLSSRSTHSPFTQTKAWTKYYSQKTWESWENFDRKRHSSIIILDIVFILKLIWTYSAIYSRICPFFLILGIIVTCLWITMYTYKLFDNSCFKF